MITIKLLTNEEIIKYLKDNPGVSKDALISKFEDEYNIESKSVQAHLYSLKSKHFLRINNDKLYYTNPFTEIYRKFYNSNSDDMSFHLRRLNARILEMVQLMSPSIYERIKKLTIEAKSEAF